MKHFLFSVLLIMCVAFYACGPVPMSAEDKQLQAKEWANPSDYVKPEKMRMNSYKINGNGYIVEGRVANFAFKARFKDVVLTVQLYSKSGKLIEQEDDTLHEYWEPRATKDFSITVHPKEGADSCIVSFKSASPKE